MSDEIDHNLQLVKQALREAQTSPVSPHNTNLPTQFFETFNISTLHVQSNIGPDVSDYHLANSPSLSTTSRPLTPTNPLSRSTSSSHLQQSHNDDGEEHQHHHSSSLSLFADLHHDHDIQTNIELLFEVLYQASSHVPGWKNIPFEILINMLDIKPLAGGLTNLLFSFELCPSLLSQQATSPSSSSDVNNNIDSINNNEYLIKQRPKTLQYIIDRITHEIANNDQINVPLLQNPTLLRSISSSYTRKYTNQFMDSLQQQHQQQQSTSLLPTTPPLTPTMLSPNNSSIPSLNHHTTSSPGILIPSNHNNPTLIEPPVIVPVEELHLPIDTMTKLHLHNNEYIFIMPTITKIVIRIYGTSEFSSRKQELDLAELASKANISEHLYCSWRHGRISSFLDGSSLDHNLWYDPILSSLSAYQLGQLHATAPPPGSSLTLQLDHTIPITSNPTTTTPLTPLHNILQHSQLHKTLHLWCTKVYRTKAFKSVQRHRKMNPKPRVSSIFDMFTDPTNQLYALNRPSLALKTNEIRLNNVLLPLPPQIAPQLLPLFNSYQLDVNEEEKEERIDVEISNENASYGLNYPYPSQREVQLLGDLVALKDGLISINDDINTITGDVVIGSKKDQRVSKEYLPRVNRILSPEELELIVEWMDPQRYTAEVDWLSSQCLLFPLVTTAHCDYHGGNVLLLNTLNQHDIQTATTSTTKSLVPPLPLDSTTASSSHSSKEITPILLPSQPFELPNPLLKWVKIIDMEYGQATHRGFDMANSLNETWVGYLGRFPGFGYDLVGTMTTHLLGEYNPEVLQLQQSSSLSTQQHSGYIPFDHPTVRDYINQPQTFLPNENFTNPQDKLNHLVKVWNQCESPQIATTLQHILLGTKADQPYQYNPTTSSSLQSRPSFRPREILWAESLLTGFYHSLVQRYNLEPLPTEADRYTTIKPFSIHLLITPEQTNQLPSNHPLYNRPDRVKKMSEYTLPSLSVWVAEQTPLLLFEASLLQLASFLQWSMWGLIMTETKSQHGYGYIDHSVVRLLMYVTKKQLLVELGLLENQPHYQL